ncbi:hypothetical protein ATANTOWER_024147 [Ataeniobius toweri]|uniref:Uncharacterized protein n=1 Tax=Ataeniobius toweri TaxID=208326 RepID=A0ABU7B586_9TELE|nr:hypothetical protein [Ataeniobius toweri]
MDTRKQRTAWCHTLCKPSAVIEEPSSSINAHLWRTCHSMAKTSYLPVPLWKTLKFSSEHRVFPAWTLQQAGRWGFSSSGSVCVRQEVMKIW